MRRARRCPTARDGLGLDAAARDARVRRRRGKCAAGSPSTPATARFQGSFNWRQQDDALELTVRGPLRNGVLQVAGRPDALTVTARGETRTLTDPEAELSELLGWWLPVASLPHWLLGFPDRGFRAVTEPGADGTLAALEQRLWRVAYPAYQLAAIGGARTAKCSCRAASI